MLRQLCCETLSKNPCIGCDPFNDSDNENCSIQSLYNHLKLVGIMKYPQSDLEKIRKRFGASIILYEMKNLQNIYETDYLQDDGPALNQNVSYKCFGIEKNAKTHHSLSEVSSIQCEYGFSAPVYCYLIDTLNGGPTEDIERYYMNDFHRDNKQCWTSKNGECCLDFHTPDECENGFKHIKPICVGHSEFDTDILEPIIASKFMNGGESTSTILTRRCREENMTLPEILQHIQTITELYGSIPIVDTIEQLEKVHHEIISKFNDEPIPNRTTTKSISFTINEILYYITQRLDDEFIVKNILASQYVLDNHGTPSLIPALQKIYALLDEGIPTVVSEKTHPDINHPDVVAFINTTSNEIIDKITQSLKKDRSIKLTDEIIMDVTKQPVDNVSDDSNTKQPKDNQIDEYDGKCKICLEEPINTLFAPCGHTMTCNNCADRICSTTNICPVCRCVINKKIKAFFS